MGFVQIKIDKDNQHKLNVLKSRMGFKNMTETINYVISLMDLREIKLIRFGGK